MKSYVRLKMNNICKSCKKNPCRETTSHLNFKDCIDYEIQNKASLINEVNND